MSLVLLVNDNGVPFPPVISSFQGRSLNSRILDHTVSTLPRACDWILVTLFEHWHHLICTQRQLEVPGAYVSWAWGLMNSDCWSQKYETQLLCLQPWKILRPNLHSRALCRIRLKALFPGPCPKFHLCTTSSFPVACFPHPLRVSSKRSSLIYHLHMNSYLRV